MSDIQTVLERIREHCAQSRVRISEFFADFDKLRSGEVTPDRFKRCLNMLGLINLVSDEEYNQIFMHYRSSKDPTKINYHEFCDAVDAVFTIKGLEKSPKLGQNLNKSMSPKTRTSNSLTPNLWAKYADQMQFFVNETITRGLMLKDLFKDFDKHGTGRVTAAQFQRCFPFRSDPETVNILIQRYREPVSKDVDYLAWVNDVEDAVAAKRHRVDVKPQSRRPESRKDYDAQSLITELQKQVLTNRIRVEEVFRDNDRLRSDLITEAQFASGLGMLKFQKFNFSPAHIKLLQDHYRVQDNYGHSKIAYARFVSDMDSVFTEKGLEKSPRKRVQPRYDLLEKSINTMGAPEEQRVEELLEHCRGMIKTRRILLKPFFQDFDRANKGLYQTRRCSRARFERALAYVGIILQPEDFKLLCDKYQDKMAGNDSDDIRYLDFCAAVETDETSSPSFGSSINTNIPAENKFIPLGKTGQLSLQEVEEDIQTHCLTARVRIHEFFRDFDTLRSGLVTKAQFATALAISGLALSPDELGLLYVRYESPSKPGYIQWLRFADAMDEVFTTKGLEQQPTRSMGTTQKILARKRGEQEPHMTGDVRQVLERLGEAVRTRGILLTAFFHDFDKHNSGRITASQFTQVLSRYSFKVSEGETTALLDCYREPRTRLINYRRFIQDVDSSEDPKLNPNLTKSRSPMSLSKMAADSYGVGEVPPPSLDGLLNWIGVKVYKNAIRVHDFFGDADRLRKGFVPRAKFRSALDMAGLKLDEIAFRILEDRFNNSAVPDTINYVEFLRQVQYTEPYAAAAPPQVMPSPTMTTPLRKKYDATAVQTRAEDEILDTVCTRIQTRRVNPKPYFQDFDKIRKERVSRTQFSSVMDKMQLSLPQGEMDRLTDLFVDQRGDVDYITFCNTVDPVY